MKHVAGNRRGSDKAPLTVETDETYRPTLIHLSLMQRLFGLL